MSGFTNYGAAALLAGAAMPTTLWLQFHVGDPGPDGVNNIALEATRHSITLEPGLVANSAVNDAAANWTGLTVDETVGYFTLWSAESGGNPWWVGEWDPDVELTNGGAATVATEAVRIVLAATVHGA